MSALRGPNGEKLDLSAYDAVRVMDFENAIKNQAERTEIVEVVRLFPARVVDEVKATGAFASVTRGGAPEKGELVVTGKVTRYEEGSATARFLIGFGEDQPNEAK